jgi:RNA-directed DNA polymerase
MPKTLRNMYDKKLTLENLYNAHIRASKHKSNRRDVLIFNEDLETNLINVLLSLKKGTYRPGNYHVFKIYEPKERIIKSLPYKDRIVQQWYIEEFIKPYFYPRFISDTYACLDNRGTHKAVKKVQYYMKIKHRVNDKFYVLKCDIHKYFYNIDKDILFNIIKSKIKDKKILELTKIIIYSDDDSKKGIPIGNYTSQYFANIYLSLLDDYIKEKLNIKYYVRYMDDFVILLNNKEECQFVKEKINYFITNNLLLEFNPKTRYYPRKMGINFCGYRIYETHILIRNSSKIKIKKDLKKWQKLKSKDKLDIKKMEASFNSWNAHVSHANSYNITQKINNIYKGI